MPPTCTICRNEKRLAIDKALSAGTPLRTIADQYRTSKTALIRHKSHVGAAIQRASEKREENIGESVLSRLERLYERGQRLMDQAEAAKDVKTALRAIGELRGLLAGMHQLALDAKSATPSGGETNAQDCPGCGNALSEDERPHRICFGCAGQLKVAQIRAGLRTPGETASIIHRKLMEKLLPEDADAGKVQ